MIANITNTVYHMLIRKWFFSQIFCIHVLYTHVATFLMRNIFVCIVYGILILSNIIWMFIIKLWILHSKLWILHCKLWILHSKLWILHSKLWILRSTLLCNTSKLVHWPRTAIRIQSIFLKPTKSTSEMTSSADLS